MGYGAVLLESLKNEKSPVRTGLFRLNFQVKNVSLVCLFMENAEVSRAILLVPLDQTRERSASFRIIAVNHATRPVVRLLFVRKKLQHG